MDRSVALEQPFQETKRIVESHNLLIDRMPVIVRTTERSESRCRKRGTRSGAAHASAPPVEFHNEKRVGADKRVPSQSLATFDALEKERVWSLGDLEERRDRCFQISVQLPVDRDDCRLLGQNRDFLERGAIATWR